MVQAADRELHDLHADPGLRRTDLKEDTKSFSQNSHPKTTGFSDLNERELAGYPY
jgi:hypothetical protein